MKLGRLALLALVGTALSGGLAGESLAKGKDNWLSQQAFKRAQGRSTEEPRAGGFTSNYDFSDGAENELFGSGRRNKRSFDAFGLDSEFSEEDEPEVFTARRRNTNDEFADEYDEYDPEPDVDFSAGKPRSLDEGFENYQPAKLVTLSEPNLAAPFPQDPLAQTLLQELRQIDSPVRVTEQQRNAIITFYRLNNFGPLWVSQMGISEKAQRAMNLLARAEDEGLNAHDYSASALEVAGAGQALSGNLLSLARFDISLTAMVVRYAEHLHSGRIVPNKMSGYYDITPPTLNLGKLLYDLSVTPDPDSHLAALAPVHPAYAAFKAALAERRTKNDLTEDEPVPAGERVKVGGRDARVPIVRQRMVKLGFLSEEDSLAWMLGHALDDAEDPGNFETVLDKALSKALKAFQESNGMERTGQIDKATINALNGPSDEANVQKLVLNMERLRWLPRDMGVRHILVNQAAFELQIIDHQKITWRTKVIVGKPETQTNIFNDVMETVVINPYWNVPKSIVQHEMLPHLTDDPYYLDDKGYEVVDASGDIVSSGSVDWWSYGDKIPYDVRQPPGDSNALGNIKFLFPNKHNIYMHDTPTKKLFKEEVRAFSHGCIRVEDPRTLAEHVLGWDRQKIDDMIDSGENQEIKLESPIPVHLAYFTAWPDETGKIVFYSDTYKRDKRLEKALNNLAVALN
jgi:murein L,D-transpeptidase YcbB/YkuD